MKTRIIILHLFCLFVFSACKRDTIEPDPVACFDIDKRLHKPGEVVTFQNCSENFEHSEWNFGGGNLSTETNPSHKWDVKGPHFVTLTVSKKGKIDSITKRVSIADSTYVGFTMDFSNWNAVYKDSTFHLYLYSMQGNNFSQGLLMYQGVEQGPNFSKLLETKFKLLDASQSFKVKFLMSLKNGERDSLLTAEFFITDAVEDLPKTHTKLKFTEIDHRLVILYK